MTQRDQDQERRPRSGHKNAGKKSGGGEQQHGDNPARSHSKASPASQPGQSGYGLGGGEHQNWGAFDGDQQRQNPGYGQNDPQRHNPEPAHGAPEPAADEGAPDSSTAASKRK